MKTFILASNNKHKIAEFKEMFKEDIILSLEEIGFNEEIIEDGTTFLENALIKAKAVNNYLKRKNIEGAILAEDSGLCVNSLNGEPGIFSARYAGGHGNDSLNRKKLIQNLKCKEDKSAYFICLIVKYNNDGSYSYVEGKTYGRIISEERGDKSFGYDCIFYSNELEKTFGEATKDEKNKVSHRGRAIKALKEII